MKNIAPVTPRTCLSAIQKNSNDQLWQSSWTKFFNIYFNFVKICVINKFRKCNWVISDELVNETITLAFTNLLRSVNTYSAEKGRFHKYFYGIIKNSVLQIINLRMKDAKAVTLDETQNEIKYFFKNKNYQDSNTLDLTISQLSLLDELAKDNPAEKLCEEEKSEALKALYKELIEITKAKVSPRIFAVFEMRVVQNLSAEETAKQLGIKPSMVDNDKYKFRKKLNEIASQSPYCDEIKNLKY